MSTVTDMESYQQFALEQQAQNNAWSAEQAQKQMDFQKMMSDTAHQREVADLKAAGLNPILSANSGAQVTQGASADADKSAAGNVGQILQQVLQTQSAREVAAMYNSATIYAAQIAAQASMYGSDMSYWNSEDHPKTLEEVAARDLVGLGASNPGAHAPGNSATAGNSQRYTDTGTGSSGANSAKSSSSSGQTKKEQVANKIKNIAYDLTHPQQAFAKLYNQKFANMNAAQRSAWNNYCAKNGVQKSYKNLLSWLYTKGGNRITVAKRLKITK